MPSTIGLTDKGLANFETYGTDTANRSVDYPGGLQDENVGTHRHFMVRNGSGNNTPALDINKTILEQNEGNGDFKYTLLSSALEPNKGRTGLPLTAAGVALTSTENRVKNNGVVFVRRMG